MYTFKLQFDKVERKLKVCDGYGIWIGTVLLNTVTNTVCTYIDHSNIDGRNHLPSDGRKLTLENLKSICIELAATSGIDEDIIYDLKEGWLAVDYECIGFKLEEVIYSDKPVENTIDDQIFNYWMKK